MRIDEQQLNTIINTLKNKVQDARLFLFGSRADDSQRGGDIDIFMITQQNIGLKEKIELLAQLEYEGIDRKIDLVIQSPGHPQEKIYNEVMIKGIPLC